MSRSVDKIAPFIGHVTIAWNDIQFGIFKIFQTLSRLKPELAESIFFAVQSDRAQREMAVALVGEVLRPLDKGLADRVNERIAKINHLAGERNNVIHVIWMADNETSEVSIFQKNISKGKKGDELVIELGELAVRLQKHAIAVFDLLRRIKQLPAFQSDLLVEALLKSMTARKEAAKQSQKE